MKSLVLLLAVLALTVSCGPCKPEQVHIALGEAYTNSPAEGASFIKLVYHTKDLCKESTVTLHTPEGDVEIKAANVEHFTATYKNGDYSTVVHEFDFPALKVGQEYTYTCNGENDKKRGPFKFHVPNPKPEAGKPTTVVMFGDWDSGELGQVSMEAFNKLMQNNASSIDAFVHMGDFAYDLESEAGKRGDRFMNDIEHIAANMPYMVFAGNHETLQNFSNMNMRYKMPNFNNTQNHLYSYNLGNIHFLVYDVELLEVQPELKDITVQWIKNDLKEANANRAERPWIVASSHRPLYCSKKHEDCISSATEERYKAIENALVEGGVDLFISGHVHYYERMHPISNYEVAEFERIPGDENYNYIKNAKAPVFILQGIAGHEKYPNHKKAAKAKKWTANLDTTYSYQVVRSMNNTHLYVEKVNSEDGQVADWFYIIKDENKVAPVEL